MKTNHSCHKEHREIQLEENSVSRGEDNTCKDNVKVQKANDFENDSVKRLTRKTEQGIIAQNKKLSIAMVFQGNPIWLLALEPNYIDKIFMVDFASFSKLATHLTDNELDFTLYNSLVSYLGRSSFIFQSPPKNIVHLISGDVNFLNDKAAMLRIKKFLYCSDNHHKY